MNNKQRTRLQRAVDRLSNFTEAESILTDASSVEALKDAVNNLESEVNDVASEERDKFDNMNEGLQNSPPGQAIEEAADNLEGVCFPSLSGFNFDTEDGREDIASQIQELIDEVEALL